MIVCAGNNEQFSFAKSIGIGLINSSINLTKISLLDKPKNIVFVGTAGTYGEKSIFDILTSYSATNIEIGYLNALSYSPLLQKVQLLNSNVSHETLDKIVVNSSNYITANKKESNKFLEAGLAIENMEFFAVLSVANYFNIPAFGIFCITNSCDKNAHKEFLKNHTKAKIILEDLITNKYKEFIK